MDQLTAEFLKDVYTTIELDDRLEEVEEASRWVYKGGSTPLSQKINNVSGEFKSLVYDLEQTHKIPSINKDLANALKKTQREIEAVPSLKITLAFQPSQEFIKSIVNKYFNNLYQKTVLDISVDPTIIAGCKMEYGGEYQDFSLEKATDEAIQQIVLNK